MKLNKLLQLLRDNAAPRDDAAAKVRLDTSAAGEAHLYVYDVIDPYWGANATALIAALVGAGDRAVHLHLNSPGGDVFEGLAMSAAIAAHPTPVACHIDGLAASAATGLALACASIEMTEGGLFMVHNSWTIAYGNKTDLRATAELLDKVDQGIAATYVRATGCTPAQAQAWMDAETWFTAAEALQAKFIDTVAAASQREGTTSAQARAAAWNLSAYANAPKPQPGQAEREATLEADRTATLARAAAVQQNNRNRLRLLAQI